MMCGFLVVSAIVMLGRFAVMVGSVMVRGRFFRHHSDLLDWLLRLTIES
jgi:hypothetical protein